MQNQVNAKFNQVKTLLNNLQTDFQKLKFNEETHDFEEIAKPLLKSLQQIEKLCLDAHQDVRDLLHVAP